MPSRYNFQKFSAGSSTSAKVIQALAYNYFVVPLYRGFPNLLVRMAPSSRRRYKLFGGRTIPGTPRSGIITPVPLITAVEFEGASAMTGKYTRTRFVRQTKAKAEKKAQSFEI
jgi:hypothetical protein